MRLSRTRMAAMLAVASVLMISEVHAQAAQAPPSSTTSTAPTTTLSAAATPSSATTTPAAVDTASTAAATPTSTAPAIQTPGPAINPFPPGTINCLDMAGCGTNEECYVLRDGLVCLDKALNWGYILSKNISGVPSVPSWSGPRSQFNRTCSVLPMPDGTDAPGLTLLVYDLIKETLPKDLLTSRYDQEMYSWYTAFSNCEPHLACVENRCVARPTSGESCTSSWQCNPQALGLDENNAPIISANTSAIRCEYENGYKSQTMTCQLLHREASPSSPGGFSAWHAIVPVVVVLVLIYFGSVIYQRRSRKRKLRKWSRVGEDERNDYHMERYDEIR
ncbi:hypothetical protein KVV02_004668 [Mortierella alpina]|uniref:Uncharacterized protein n=1 Tax=Mortierella alpina TaxID=64518 RepID=A0A9P8A8J9_MORAP|nr:hypothetical protein KVV02_004668 [Mortierella alpina]